MKGKKKNLRKEKVNKLTHCFRTKKKATERARRKEGGVKTRKDKKVEKGNRRITKWFGGTEKIQDK